MTGPLPPPLPAAVVFDCDGTLVDSELAYRRATATALEEFGVTLTDADFARMVGLTWARTREVLVELFGFDAGTLEAYLERERHHVRPLLDDPAIVLPDAVATLDALEEAGVPVAVCTSSGRGHLAGMLSLPGLVGRFPVRVAREDTEEHKPSPVPYLRAIARLEEHVGGGLAPARVAVVEDSAPGVTAGLAAGCWTVAVDRGLGLHDLSAAHAVVERIDLVALRPGWPSAPAS